MASRALELNGVASVSDGSEDTTSIGGSDTDTSRADGKSHTTRPGSLKKPSTFKPISFAKFTIPKPPGSTAPSKPAEKGTCVRYHVAEAEPEANLLGTHSKRALHDIQCIASAQHSTAFGCQNHKWVKFPVQIILIGSEEWRQRARPQSGLEQEQT